MPFAIDDLPNVIGHWSADQISGLSDGDPVDALPDSISNWDMEATGGNRPLYRPAGINSLPAIEFDGTDDFIQTTASRTLDANIRFGSACICNFDVLKNYNTLGSLHASAATPINGSSRFLVFCYSSGLFISRFEGAYLQIGGLLATTDHLLTSVGSERGFSCMINGEGNGISGSAAPALFTGGSLYAGFGNSTLGNAELDGLLSEWVIWEETELNEQFWVEGVLAHKYGIPLPSIHPFSAGPPTSAPGSGGGSTTHNPFRSRAFAG